MTVSRTCKPQRNRAGIDIDYSNGEYIEYELWVSSGGGAFNDGFIVSLHDGELTDVDGVKNVILDHRHEVSPGYRKVRWPENDPWIGNYAHTLVLTFVRALKYSFTAKVMNGDGSLKSWIKDCTYERTQQTDQATVTILVGVHE